MQSTDSIGLFVLKIHVFSNSVYFVYHIYRDVVNLHPVARKWTCLPFSHAHIQRDRVDFRFAPSQWETALLCNDVSHWLGTKLELALLNRYTSRGIIINSQVSRSQIIILNTWRPKQNYCHFTETFSIAFSWMKMYEFCLGFHWNLFLGFELTITQH